MSDTYLRYVPTLPTFMPEETAGSRAEQFLRQILDAESIESRSTARIEFVDAGENWDGVSCPKCGADAESWWGEAMSAAAEEGFENLTVQVECCRTAVGLNDLRYGWPVAFGRYVLEAANRRADGISQDALDELGRLLGSPVRQVKCHV